MLIKNVQGVQLTPDLILADNDVRAGLVAAWVATQKLMVEHGGWIYYNNETRSYRTKQKKGDKVSVTLTPAPAYNKDPQGYEIVADWHCHPGKQVRSSRPSDEDIANAKHKNYFMFVVTAKSEPQAGWKQELLKQVAVVDDTPAEYRIWNIV